MRTTITFRADAALRESLEERARAKGVSVSALVREILATALDERPMGERVGDLGGTLRLCADHREAWRESLRRRNWRT